MSGLARRSPAGDLMDTEAVPFETFRACLRDLERINRWTFAYRITLDWLDRLTRIHRPSALTVLDVGSGYGDMLRRVAAWGTGRGLVMDLCGVDLNPHAARAAAAASGAGYPVRYITADVFDLQPAPRPDVVISALFTHHLDAGQLVRFLRWMEETATLGWLVNDLHRHALPYRIARVAPALLRMNRLVRHDAAVSVARAFTRRDWTELLDRAGLAGPPTTVRWCVPFRFAVGRIKPQ